MQRGLSMLSIEKFRRKFPSIDATDDEIQSMIQNMYSLAETMVDQYLVKQGWKQQKEGD